MHKDDYPAECNTMLSGREVSLDRSLLPSSSMLMVAESISRTLIPFCQTAWRHTPEDIRLSDLTRCRKFTSTMQVVHKGLSSQGVCHVRSRGVCC
jgi:hypothetical protein